MPKVSYQKEARLRRIIRDAMAVDPFISIKSLMATIEKKTNRTIDDTYLSKLVKSVNAEMTVVADREKIEDRITYLRESNRIIRDELFRIAFPAVTDLNPPKPAERIRALELIAKIDNAQVKIEMDLGLFTRHLGTVDIDHHLKPPDEDIMKAVVGTFQSWGIAPPQTRKTEPQRMIEAKVEVLPEITKNDEPKPKQEPTGIVSGADLLPA